MKSTLKLIFALNIVRITVALSFLDQNSASLSSSQNCYDHPSPLKDQRKLKPIRCEFNKPVQQSKALKNGVESETSKQMIKINLSCKEEQNLCTKVEKAFNTAATYLENVFIFKAPIIVNASFYSFCQVNSQCIEKNLITLGQAGAARSIALIGDDGKRRLYPQALVKQLSLQKMPRFSNVDIVAEFNSDANFWFEGMSKMKDDQSDFLLVISHELIHGLGFSSSYADYFNDDAEALTPFPELLIDDSGAVKFGGFTENIFDKYIVQVKNGKDLSVYTDSLNKLSTKNLYTSQTDFEAKFRNSNQYKDGKTLLALATTKESLALKVSNNPKDSKDNMVILETSLKPFTSLSSISHVDYKSYTKTQDFLMRYKTDTGDTLPNLVGKLGQWKEAPYGPSVIGILEMMGYATNSNPNPQIKVSVPNFSAKPNSLIVVLLSVYMAYVNFK